MRFDSQTGVVQYIENDIENNKLGDYKQSNEQLKKLKQFVLSLDILTQYITGMFTDDSQELL